MCEIFSVCEVCVVCEMYDVCAVCDWCVVDVSCGMVCDMSCAVCGV